MVHSTADLHETLQFQLSLFRLASQAQPSASNHPSADDARTLEELLAQLTKSR